MFVPNFSWVMANVLAASARPQGLAELLALSEEGIRSVVTLTEAPLNPSELQEAGLDSLHLPVPDFTPPSLDQVRSFVDHLTEKRAANEPVLIHCTAGIGRTGTMIACFLAQEDNLSGDEAIRHTRILRPGSIETAEQESLIHAWAQSLRSENP